VKALTQVATLIRRRLRAKRLGIDFRRAATWNVPRGMCVDGKRWTIKAPAHNGCKLAFLEIFLDDCYGIESVRHPVRTVLDIGANAGFFSMHARNTYPNAVIHAYEPNPAMREFLQHQSCAGRFAYFMEAVGAADAKVRLDLDSDSTHTRSIPTPLGDIPQVAFRKCILRLGGNVDVVKIDCEGAEWEILDDADAWRKVRYLALEYHLRDGDTRSTAILNVTRLGFRILKHATDGPSRGTLWAEHRSPANHQ
jgi:FkbM family methyltransferase